MDTSGQVFEYLAAHRLILGLGERKSDLGDLMNNKDVGEILAYSEIDSIRGFIEDIFENDRYPAKEDTEMLLNQFSHKHLVEKLEDFLTKKMNKIRVGLIGCGRIAQRHAGHIAKMGQLVAVCDVNPEKARKLGEEYEIPFFSDVETFLTFKDMDVVSVCSPNGLHAEHTIKSLNSGFHVLCEKPMALSSADCEEMIKTAERCNKRLFIVKQNRFNPAIEAVKEKIDQGALGKIYSIQLNCFWNRNFDYYQKSEWKGTKDLDGGTLFTQFSHFVDLLYWMIGDVEEASAMLNNYAHNEVIEFEDTGVVSLKFKNGVLGTINYTVNSYAKNMEGSITIFAEKGTVKVGGQYLNKLEYQSLEGEEIGELRAGNPANEYGEYQGSMSNHDRVYENLIDVLLNDGSIATNGLEGLKTVEIIEKIYKSANG